MIVDAGSMSVSGRWHLAQLRARRRHRTQRQAITKRGVQGIFVPSLMRTSPGLLCMMPPSAQTGAVLDAEEVLAGHRSGLSERLYRISSTVRVSREQHIAVLPERSQPNHDARRGQQPAGFTGGPRSRHRHGIPQTHQSSRRPSSCHRPRSRHHHGPSRRHRSHRQNFSHQRWPR